MGRKGLGDDRHRSRLDNPGTDGLNDPRYDQAPDLTLKSALYRALMRAGPQRLSRDISIVHERLVGQGRAVWLGERWKGASAAPEDAMLRAVERVKQLAA